jgi:molecular chaperone DnaJ
MFTGAQQQQPRGPQPGSDLEYQATVDFWTAIRGGQARLDVHRQETVPPATARASTGGPTQCSECNGTGQVTQMGGRMKFNINCPRCNGTGRTTNLCSTCHGEGLVEPRRGGRVSHQGRHARRAEDSPARQGQRRVNGGAPGDLFLIVRTGTHPVFTRVGDDIQLTVPVTMPEASLGAKVDVPTIDGRAQLKIPPGTQSGQKLRMRERGVESSQHPGKRGDEIVTIEVTVPTLSDERSREIMRELAKLNNQDPRVALFDKL